MLFLARPRGFEPLTYRFVAGHSIRWAKGAHFVLEYIITSLPVCQCFFRKKLKNSFKFSHRHKFWSKNRDFFDFFWKILLTNPIRSDIILSVRNIGVSPSGKASDSDSDISGVRIPAPQPEKRQTHLWVGLFSVIFACGEFYCFAVIFGLRRVIFASRVW